jgi:hypothetical protein
MRPITRPPYLWAILKFTPPQEGSRRCPADGLSGPTKVRGSAARERPGKPEATGMHRLDMSFGLSFAPGYMVCASCATTGFYDDSP